MQLPVLLVPLEMRVDVGLGGGGSGGGRGRNVWCMKKVANITNGEREKPEILCDEYHGTWGVVVR